MTQTDKILWILRKGQSLTPLEALKRVGTLRLGARILELRQAGYPIRTTMVRAHGSRVARYSMRQV